MANKTGKEKIMSTSYTEKELKDQLKKDTTKEKMRTLYDAGYVNKKRPVSDNKEKPHYDVIAEFLLKNKHLFSNDYIPIVERKLDYIQEGHGEPTDEEKALVDSKKRGEEWFAKCLYNSKFDDLGKIIDYQTPIKKEQGDKAPIEREQGKKAGKVDLLAYDKDKWLLSLIELKREYNKETMLRAILEICTYSLQIDEKKLIKELKEKKNIEVKKIQKAVLVFKDSIQYEQYKTSELIRELAGKLGVVVYIVENKKIDITQLTP
jgi:hypothetical protein